MSLKTILDTREPREEDQHNPSAQQFGYNDMTIVAKRDIAPSVSGNTGGRYGKAKWYTVSDKPVEKRKTKK